MKTSVVGHCPCENCPHRGHAVRLTKHHIFPLRWRHQFKKEVAKDYRNELYLLCRDCHDSLELLITQWELHEGRGKRVKMNWLRYPYLLREFVLGRLHA